MRNSLASLLGALLAVSVLGCGSGQSKSQPTSNPPPSAHETKCPMMPSAGTDIVATDTDDGIAIAFTTAGDVAELRARIHHMAEMHDKMTEMHHDMHDDGSAAGGMEMGSGTGNPGMMHMQMVPSRATVEEIAGGARIVLVPTEPSQLEALRTHAREHVTMMQKGECPMGAEPQPQDEHAGHHPNG